MVVTRGPFVESAHHGAYCVVRGGKVTRSKGDVGLRAFFRSAAKPFQVLTVLESGAADRFAFTEKELALVVGSHNGSPEHAAVAHGILQRIGAKVGWLRCGGHRSISRAVYEQYAREGYQPGRLEDNCSGKHAGMIAAAIATGEDPESYAELDHPVQRRNREQVARFAGVTPDDLGIGADGCGVPSFFLSIEAMARAIQRWGTPDLFDEIDDATRGHIARVQAAIAAHPDMVAGPDRFDTKLMRASGGKMLVKMGAEGVLIASSFGGDVGIALKIEDGATRALYPFMAALLVDEGLLSADDVADFYPRSVDTRMGTPCGGIEVEL